jgi:hypothetical protein
MNLSQPSQASDHAWDMMMFADPRGHFILGQFSGRDGLNNLGCINLLCGQFAPCARSDIPSLFPMRFELLGAAVQRMPSALYAYHCRGKPLGKH